MLRLQTVTARARVQSRAEASSNAQHFTALFLKHKADFYPVQSRSKEKKKTTIFLKMGELLHL
ncbi:UNVERIFIED_CONTAM: hypothetical protein FKN15_065258 [Acipenser sinensis]